MSKWLPLILVASFIVSIFFIIAKARKETKNMGIGTKIKTPLDKLMSGGIR